jgi:hypothetical protein
LKRRRIMGGGVIDKGVVWMEIGSFYIISVPIGCSGLEKLSSID